MKFNTPVPKYELENRLNAFKSELEKKDKSWQMVLINNPVNLYYLRLQEYVSHNGRKDFRYLTLTILLPGKNNSNKKWSAQQGGNCPYR